MRRKFLFTLTIAVLALAAAGCKKKEERVVATVGRHTISFEEVEKQYGPPRPGTPEEKMQRKRDALDALIKDKLFLNDAEDKGYADNEEVKTLLEERKRILVVNQLYKVEVVDKVTVTPSEVREAYDLMKEDYDLKHILLGSEEEAADVYDSLRAGASFEALAMEKSIDPATKEKGGSMGWVRRGVLSSELLSAAQKLAQGEFSTPVKDLAGWHILMLVGRRAAQNLRTFEDEQKRIETTLKQEKMKERADAFLNALKERTNITYKEDVVKSVAEKTPQERVSPWAPAPLPTVTDAEKEMVLVTTSKGDWTVGRVMEYAAKVPPRGSIGTPEGLKQWVEMLILQEELVQEALKRRLDRASEVRGELESVLYRRMISLVHRDQVEQKAEPTEEEVKASYEANKDKYAIPEKNWVRIIVTATEDQAKEVLKSLKRGADFDEVAREKSIHPTKSRGGNMGIVYESKDPEVFNIATKLKVERLSAPTAVQDGWAIVKVTKREEKKPRSFEEAKRQVEREVKFANLTRIEDAYLVELKEKYTVTTDEELLKEVGEAKEEEMKKAEEGKEEAR
jgi:peptidyl-prolyl cis-trans isomerase C